MPKYTPAQKADALQHATKHGPKATSAHTGIPERTITRWANTTGTTLHDPRKTVVANADRKSAEERALAEAERAKRQSSTQVTLGRVAEQQGTLVASHQTVSARLVVRVLRAIEVLEQADQAVIRAGNGAGLKDALAVQKRASTAVDTELERARKASISLGVHVDKLWKLSGEADVPTAEGSASAALTALLTQDPAFRQDVAMSLRERYLAIPTTSTEVEG